MQKKSLITLFKNRTGWNARFSGPCVDEIRPLFGTDTLPLPWTADAQAPVVLLDMVGRWPDVDVEVEGAR